ncbi:MAG: hypothetical protein KGY44_09290 [Halanaerobiales bacterium]|nr:hypothetical protein [Halanaerobiales bacterium]
MVKKLNEKNIKINIYIFIPPCVFSSGKEAKVLLGLKGVEAVYNSKDYLKFILFNIKPSNFKAAKKGFVLFLGGDLMHAVFLAKRLNYPVYSYTERDYGFIKSIKKFYVSDQKIYQRLLKKGADPAKLKVVGNLIIDSVQPGLNGKQAKAKLNKKDDQIIINLMPGSRPREFEYILPLFLNTATEIKQKKSKYRFVLTKAPFINEKEIKRSLRDKRINSDTVYNKEENRLSIDDFVIEIYEEDPYSIMREADFALTIPGTNNLELAVLETPMLVILPLNKPELIPLPGLIGLLGEIPLLGKFLKRVIIPKMSRNRKYISLINLLQEKEIVPEMRGLINNQDLTAKILDLLEGEGIKVMKKRLQNLRLEGGAADHIINDILQNLNLKEENN